MFTRYCDATDCQHIILSTFVIIIFYLILGMQIKSQTTLFDDK
jgi:hypothetical protein